MAHLLSDNEGRNGTVYVPVYTKPDFAQPVHVRMTSRAPRRVRRSWPDTITTVLGVAFACVWVAVVLLALGLGLREIAIAAFRLATGGHV